MKAISHMRFVAMNTPSIVSPEAWEAARLEMLGKEKAFTRGPK
jgi:predicted dithiol-disulfide oxidoreductase (DUF899 family)